MPWGTAEQPPGTQYVLTGVDTDPNAAVAGVNGTRAFWTIKQVGAAPRVDIPTILSLDTDHVLDVLWDKTPAGNTWELAIDPRYIDANNRLQVRLLIPPSPTAMTLQLWRRLAGTWTQLSSVSTGLAAQANIAFRVRSEARLSNPTVFQARVWLAAFTEPTAPQLAVLVQDAALQVAGSLGWGLSSFSGTPTNLPVTVLFDNVDAVDPLGAPGAVLSGSSAGRGTASGILTTAIPLIGSSAGRGTAQGILTVPGSGALTGSSAGRGTATGILNSGTAIVLTGSSAGRGTAQGILTVGAEPPSLPPGGSILSIANFAENKLLDIYFGRYAYTVPTSWYIQLTSTIPTDANNGTALLARRQIPNDPANWPVSANGQKANGLPVDFGATTGQVTLPSAWGWEIWDAVTGGNRHWWGTLLASFATADRRAIVLPAGTLVLGLD